MLLLGKLSFSMSIFAVVSTIIKTVVNTDVLGYVLKKFQRRRRGKISLVVGRVSQNDQIQVFFPPFVLRLRLYELTVKCAYYYNS